MDKYMKEITVKFGEVYKVGECVIGCGDSTNKEFVDKVLNGKKIKCILTDPPYGVAYGKNNLNNISVDKAIENDHLQSESEYTEFTKSYLSLVIPYLAEYNACYIFNSDLMYSALRQAIKEVGMYYSQMLVWIKGQPVMGRKDYLPQFELMAYSWFGKHKMERSKAKNVFFHPKPQSSKLHPTMKPIGLLRKIIPNSTRINDYVYDPFLGSGSTAIACQHLGRRCIGIEIDPEYVEVSLTRLEKLTGLTREKIN